MDKHEAIASVAAEAIRSIHAFAKETIVALVGYQGEATTQSSVAVTNANPPAMAAESVDKRRPGRPRKETPQEDTAVFVKTEVSTNVENVASTVVETVASTAVEVLADFENGVFPDYKKEWFEYPLNLDTAKGICREIVSLRLKQTKDNSELVQKEIINFSKQRRVSLFSAENCFDYYTAMRNQWPTLSKGSYDESANDPF